jgi:peptide/nickel transport system substrate-binding protein
MRKFLVTMLSLLTVLTMLVACGPQATEAPTEAPTEPPAEEPTEAPTEPPAEEDFQAGMVTDVGGIDDASFNATSWAGMEMAAEELGITVDYLESQQQTDYAPNITQFLEQDYNVIVTVGFLLAADTYTFASENSDTNFAIVDFGWGPGFWDENENPRIDNLQGLLFSTDQAAFLAGYVAAGMTETGAVGTFGGLEIPTVTIFMDAYAAGVDYYNEQNGTDVQVLGTDLFVGNFESTEDGRRVGEDLIAEGADIIMPVAGPVGLGTAAAVQANPGTMLIGVDTDWCVSAPEYCDVTLTSVMKNMDVAVFTALEQAYNGDFQGGTNFVGTLANEGVQIAPFNEFEDEVPQELKDQLDEVRQGIIDGGIDTGASLGIEGETEAPAEEEEPMEEAAAGGTFIFGRGGDSVQLDPAVVTDGESFRVTGQCLEPLYQYEPGSTKPIPALATGCTANEDSTEWTCELREGVKFHDGTDFNADAVIFNFDRWRFTDNPHHYESQFFEYYEYMWNGFDENSMIAEIEKVDDYTVKFILAEPLAPFLANLAMDMFAISSPAAIEEYGADYGLPGAGCVGTGPFKFVEWVEGDHITVEANEDYWGGRPSIDEIVWRVIPDDSARFLALQAGDIHALEQAVVEDLQTAEEDPELYVETRPALNTGYLAFPFQTEEFQDINVRQAVVHAINREGLVENFYGKYGEVANNFLPPLIWGHNDDIEPWEYDPEMSQQLLADAGYPDGLSEVTIAFDITDAEGNVVYEQGEKLPLTLYYMPVTRFYYPSPQEIGEAMAADLTRAGFEVTLELAGDWPTYLGLRREGLLPGLYMLGWGGDNGDPDNFHNYFFGGLSSADAEKELDPREAFYANQEVAELCYEGATTPNQEERVPIYEEIEQILHDDVARLWIAHNNTPLIFRQEISGYVPQPVGADYYEGTVIEQ